MEKVLRKRGAVLRILHQKGIQNVNLTVTLMYKEYIWSLNTDVILKGSSYGNPYVIEYRKARSPFLDGVPCTSNVGWVYDVVLHNCVTE